MFENYLLISKITPQTLDQYWSTLVKNVLLPAGDDGQVDQPERLLQADNVLRPGLLRILKKATTTPFQ